MIERDLTRRLRRLVRQFPAVTLTGPRQSGKSTLCRAVFPKHPLVNLEAPDVRNQATEDPRGFLAQFPRGAVLDEIQRCPELPSYLQSIIDADPAPGRWILTGSQNLLLLQSVSQSLAGRTVVLHLLPLARSEVCRFRTHPVELDESLLTGGYPRIFDQKLDPADWLGSYVATYLERDVRTITQVGDLALFQRFLELCAGRTAQLLNLSDLARDCGVSQPTAKNWLSILETAFITFRLRPWSGNVSKRLIKTPKLHFYDAGLACRLLNIRHADQLRSHPLRGAIFETWVVTEIVKHRVNRGETGGVYFYRDRQGNEADVLIDEPGTLTVVEAKSGQTVATDTLASLHRLRDALQIAGRVRGVLIHGGGQNVLLHGLRAAPWSRLHELNWSGS